MSPANQLHAAVKRGDLAAMRERVTPRRGSEVVRVLLAAGSDPGQRNKHGLTPLACALGGAEGQWKRFSNASLEDWRRCVELLQPS